MTTQTFMRRPWLHGAAALLALVATINPAGAAAPVPPGQGSAQAFTVGVVPRAAALAAGVVLGESLAGHTNGIAKAQSQAIDLQALGGSLTAYDCGQPPAIHPDQLPQPLIVETGDPGAAAGITQAGDGGTLAGQADRPAFTRFGQADATPAARAVTTTAPIPLAGVATIGAGSATTWSGLVRGQREAGATVDIAGLTLPGGVTLSGLHWEVVDQSTGAKRATATFTIARATGAGGLAVPTTDPSATIATLNTVLAPVGLALTAPRAHTSGGTLFVDPLQLSVVPSPTRDSLVDAGLAAIQPVRQQVIGAVLQAFCRADNAVSISDVAIGSLTGAGSFTVSLGGVQAVSGELAANAFNLGAGVGGLGPLTPPGGLATAPTGVGASPLVPGAGATATPAPSGGGTPQPHGSAAIGPLRTVSSHGSHSGPLAAVALGALALLAVVAEGDRRFMGRGRRAMRFED